MLMRSFVIQSC